MALKVLIFVEFCLFGTWLLWRKLGGHLFMILSIPFPNCIGQPCLRTLSKRVARAEPFSFQECRCKLNATALPYFSCHLSCVPSSLPALPPAHWTQLTPIRRRLALFQSTHGTVGKTINFVDRFPGHKSGSATSQLCTPGQIPWPFSASVSASVKE